MTAGAFPAPAGTWPGVARPFAGVADAAPAGSAHWLLAAGAYEFWSAASPCAVFFTNGATDPTAVPAAQPATAWPGFFVPAGCVYAFTFDPTVAVYSPTQAALILCTGIRVWTLAGAPGAFYVNNWSQLQK